MSARERLESPLRTTEGTASPVPAGSTEPAELPLRELTGWEEEYLERHQHEPNTARVCDEVLARCCVPPGAEPGDDVRERVRQLLVAERDRELVRLRRMSLGPDVEAEVTCPSCSGSNEATFSLDALDLGFTAPARSERFDLGAGDVVEVRLPTAGDQEDLLDAGIDNPAERRTWLLARCVRDDNGASLDLAAARAMPVRRRAALDHAIEEHLPQLDLQMSLKCVHCGSAFTAPFDVPSFFFRHDRAGSASAPRRASAGAGLPLVGTPDLGPPAAPSHRLPAAARGRGGRRAARRADQPRLGRRAVLTPGHLEAR
ncbi:hypothetical protein [Kribbella sancticallisti]|uniref:T4 family baseplate hub assembly chaperone n=1 Tax=Kribbella sancticallisti TaxID=460087 RepID=UPI0031D56AFA